LKIYILVHDTSENQQIQSYSITCFFLKSEWNR